MEWRLKSLNARRSPRTQSRWDRWAKLVVLAVEVGGRWSEQRRLPEPAGPCTGETEDAVDEETC